MNKKEFISELKSKLSILKKEEVNDIVNEYSEHIEEKIKSGKSEKEAIEEFGDIDELVGGILDAYKIDKEYYKKTSILDNIAKDTKEVFNKIKEEAKNFPCLEDFVDEYYDKPGFEFVQDIKYVEPLLGGEDHRWFIVGNSVYSILINGENYYFGASEVTTLKSETMSFEDTYWETEIFKVKKVIKECWEVEK